MIFTIFFFNWTISLFCTSLLLSVISISLPNYFYFSFVYSFFAPNLQTTLRFSYISKLIKILTSFFSQTFWRRWLFWSDYCDATYLCRPAIVDDRVWWQRTFPGRYIRENTQRGKSSKHESIRKRWYGFVDSHFQLSSK